MKRRISWSAKASADYHGQLEFIAEENPNNADLVDQRLMAAIELLAEDIADYRLSRHGRDAPYHSHHSRQTQLA